MQNNFYYIKVEQLTTEVRDKHWYRKKADKKEDQRNIVEKDQRKIWYKL